VAQRLNHHFMEMSLEKLTIDIKVSLLEMARLSAPLNVESPSEELSPAFPSFQRTTANIQLYVSSMTVYTPKTPYRSPAHPNQTSYSSTRGEPRTLSLPIHDSHRQLDFLLISSHFSENSFIPCYRHINPFKPPLLNLCWWIPNTAHNQIREAKSCKRGDDNDTNTHANFEVIPRIGIRIWRRVIPRATAGSRRRCSIGIRHRPNRNSRRCRRCARLRLICVSITGQHDRRDGTIAAACIAVRRADFPGACS
jgi:hypothetical protein